MICEILFWLSVNAHKLLNYSILPLFPGCSYISPADSPFKLAATKTTAEMANVKGGIRNERSPKVLYYF